MQVIARLKHRLFRVGLFSMRSSLRSLLLQFDLWFLAALTLPLLPISLVDHILMIFLGKGLSGRSVGYQAVFWVLLAIALYGLFIATLKFMGERHKFILWWAAVLLVGVGAAAYAALGWWSRFMADDFCTREIFANGWINGAVWYYRSLSGRFSFHLLRGATNFFSSYFAQIAPTINLLVFIFSFAGLLHQLFSRFQKSAGYFVSLTLAGLLLLFFLAFIPNLFQSFLWLDGSLIYFSSLSFLWITLWVAGVTLQNPARPLYALLFFMAMLCAGFNEPLTAALLSGASLILLFYRNKLWGDASLRRVFLALALGWLAGGLLLVFAPGTFARAGMVGVRFNLPFVMDQLFRQTSFFLYDRFVSNPTGIFAILMLFYILGRSQPRATVSFKAFLSGLIIIIGMFMASFTPLIVTTTAETRPLTAATLLVILGLGTCGFFLGQWIRPLRVSKITVALTCLVLALTLAAAAWENYQLVEPDFRQFAVKWDERHFDLLSQRAQGAEVGSTSISFNKRFLLSDLRADKTYWASHCVAAYYGFKEINLTP